MKRTIWGAAMLLTASASFAADPKNLLTCNDQATGTLVISEDGQDLKLQTKFTYDLFDKIYKGLFSEGKHIPGDLHNAAILLTVPLSSCQNTPIGETCDLKAPGGTFETDVLGVRSDVLLTAIKAQKDSAEVKVAFSLVRAGRPTLGSIEFPLSECK